MAVAPDGFTMHQSVSGMLCERLLDDDETKDVDIEMSDGVLKVHSVVLRASSDAIGAMLKHGIGATRRTLSWKEHPTKVGRFFVGLLYTGSVGEEFFNAAASDEESTGDKAGSTGNLRLSQLPLDLLLGSLQIAKVYMVHHLLHIITEALSARLAVDSFDEIASAAIRLDLTALRMRCMRYAEEAAETQVKQFQISSCGEPRAVGPWRKFERPRNGHPCYCKEEDDRCRIYHNTDKQTWTMYFKDHEGKPTLYRSQQSSKQISADLVWRVAHGRPPAPTFAIPGNEPAGEGTNSLRQMFDEGKLSPEVAAELSQLWGRAAKKRRLALASLT
eukprot:TRINITY_DN73184_c0_g1_i1.p1 TRINITY_DN73184_c0_g1~~TRINITY_DN73184_c0_g1_i1.p1  ORF type:complete len:331 (-),score=54.89 TRINITY_DN73184_c0_g1_i1:100-1092(-)